MEVFFFGERPGVPFQCPREQSLGVYVLSWDAIFWAMEPIEAIFDQMDVDTWRALLQGSERVPKKAVGVPPNWLVSFCFPFKAKHQGFLKTDTQVLPTRKVLFCAS